MNGNHPADADACISRMTWKRGIATLRATDGAVFFRRCYRTAGPIPTGLVANLCRNDRGLWRVTHELTGHMVAGDAHFKRATDAIGFAEFLLSLASWRTANPDHIANGLRTFYFGDANSGRGELTERILADAKRYGARIRP